MVSYRGGQRRRHGRERLPTPYPVVVRHGNRSYHAFLMNISKSGAGMQSAERNPQLRLTAGDEVSFDVTVTFGVSVVWGRIAWVSVQNGVPVWGVEFTKLSNDPNDPLRRLIDTLDY